MVMIPNAVDRAVALYLVRCVVHAIQVQEAQTKGSKAKAQAEADQAQARLDKYNERLAEVKSDGLPKVEVGTLEDVLTKMENDTEGTWEEVMFIPPGAATTSK